jgi:multicomponent Na+:H+ antiporter subunit E
VLVRILVLLFLWWVLAEGALSGPLLTAVIIAATLVTSFWLVPVLSSRLSPRGVVRFLPYFLAQSLRGGLDVARRALDPRLPIAPILVEYEPTLASESTRIFFAAIVSLLPGTLSVEMSTAGSMRIHVLSGGSFRRAHLVELERRVADLVA